MKRAWLLTLTTGALCAWTVTRASADALLEGQIDFGAFTPSSSGGEFVEVNIPPNLIALASRFIEKEEPDVAKLLRGIKLVRVNVIGVDDQNREEMTKRAEKVRQDLNGHGWTRLVTAKQKEQDVGVYLKMGESEVIQGLAIVVLEGGKQAVFVNIVGDIRPEQLTTLGERLQIEPLKELGKQVKPESQADKQEK